MQIGKRVAELLEQRGLSQYRLAQLSGIGQGALSEIIGGKRDPSTATMQKLCAGLGITMAEFFSPAPDGPDRDADPDLRLIAQARGRMSGADRKKMMRILRASFEEYFGQGE